MRPVNAVTTVVTDYGTDPHNPATGVVTDAFHRLHGFLVNVVTGADGSDERTFHGYAAEQQAFRGAAAPTGNPITYRDASPEISNALVEGPMGDPSRRIFAARLRRRLA